jgi:UDP-GlcNAc:undecaprenyl-phosphate/decaprenyl-phosphate GlcNAc-1-phosphate transferase
MEPNPTSLPIVGKLFDLIQSWFANPQWSWVDLLVISTGFSFLMTPIIGRLAKRFGAIDVPRERSIHESPTPLWGGLAIYISFLATILIFYNYSIEMKGVTIGATIILVLGVLDDFRELSALIRLAGQLLAVAVVLAFGVRLDILPVFETEIGDMCLTAIWIIGITNAMNFLDGMDGLATGCAAIQAAFLSIFAWQTGQVYLGALSIALAGSCLGFLPYNFRPFRPAKIFLGDTGSTFLGFTIASLTIMSEWATDNPIKALSAPLLITGVLTFDMIYITIYRFVTNKVATFKELMDYVGKDHIHHRLNDVGFTRRQTVLFIYLINICFGIGAIVLLNARTIDAALLIIQAVAIALIISRLEALGRNRADIGIDELTRLSNRGYLTQRLNEELSRAKRHDRPLSYLSIRIDDLETINQNHGRFMGDTVLRELAEIIVDLCRVSDVVCRHGDGFAMILPETDPAGAKVFAERIRQQVEEQVFDSDQQRLHVTVNISVVGYDVVSPEYKPEDLLLSAEAAFADTKQTRRNRVAVNAEDEGTGNP